MRLIVSIIIKIGIKKVGVPSGNKWLSAWVGWLCNPIITVASHKGVARPKFIESCVVGVNVYGIKPNIFKETRKIIKEIRIKAHLWPPLLTGKRSCCVKVLINIP